MAFHGATLIHMRNRFYKSSHYRLLLLFLLSVVMNGVLATITWHLYREGPTRVYFATSDQGRLLRDIPVNIPLLTDEQLQTFIKDAVESVGSFDFLNYRKNIQDARGYFTAGGFTDYLKGFQASGNFRTVLAEKFVVQAKVTGPAKIKVRSTSPRYTWTVNVPVNFIYESPKQRYVQPLIAYALIGRVLPSASKNGVMIAQLVFSDNQNQKR